MHLQHLRLLKSYFAPSHCDICQRKLLESEHLICNKCNTMIKANQTSNDQNSLMAKLFWGIGQIHRAGALFDYQADAPVSELLVDIKYRGYADACQRLGRALASHFAKRDFFEGIDLILPVPLSKQRLRKRGYNQSERIARGINDITSLPIDTKSVQRIVDNKTQTHLSQSERISNVENIFGVSHPEQLTGRHILIVDDIVTTGATISSLIRSINEVAPDVSYSILALGRGNAGNLVQLQDNYHTN